MFVVLLFLLMIYFTHVGVGWITSNDAFAVISVSMAKKKKCKKLKGDLMRSTGRDENILLGTGVTMVRIIAIVVKKYKYTFFTKNINTLSLLLFCVQMHKHTTKVLALRIYRQHNAIICLYKTKLL